ncbi:MAG: hypothetical protein SGPRY_014807 [Prymnesium sp.]
MALSVRTNMQSHTALLSASLDGSPCDPSSVMSFESSDDGTLQLSPSNSRAAVEVEVPAAFNVKVAMRNTRCDVAVRGWLEGDVDVSTGEGHIEVGTVKGVLTSTPHHPLIPLTPTLNEIALLDPARLRTGSGDVRVQTVEGNLDVESGGGDVVVGKAIGEEVSICIHFSVSV